MELPQPEHTGLALLWAWEYPRGPGFFPVVVQVVPSGVVRRLFRVA